MLELEYELLNEVTSTMDVAKDYAKRRSKDFLLQALSQSRGKGQHSRKFSSGLGGFYGTFTIIKDSRVINLRPIMVAYCLIKQMKEFLGVDLFIKWPNDLYAFNKKKLGGILIEQDEHSWRIGIGINTLNDAIGPISDQATSIDELANFFHNNNLAPLVMGKGIITQRCDEIAITYQSEENLAHRNIYEELNIDKIRESLPYPLSSMVFQTTSHAVIASIFDLVNSRYSYADLPDYLIWPSLITFQQPGKEIKTGKMVGLDSELNLLLATTEDGASVLHTIVSSGMIIDSTW